MMFQRGVAVGWELPPVSRQMSLQQFEERHALLYGDGTWPHKNIHSDPEAAKAEGLSEPVGSAPTFFALVTRAMKRAPEMALPDTSPTTIARRVGSSHRKS